MTWKELNGIFYQITKGKKFKSRTDLYKHADVSRTYCIDRIKNYANDEVGDNILGKLRAVFPEYIPESTESTESTENTKTTIKDKGAKQVKNPDDNEDSMNLATALALIKDLRGDTSQLGNTIHRQTIMIENLLNRNAETKLMNITEDIMMRLQSVTDVLAQVGAGHRFSDENAVLRQINIKDDEFAPPHRERKRTDIRKSDM